MSSYLISSFQFYSIFQYLPFFISTCLPLIHTPSLSTSIYFPLYLSCTHIHSFFPPCLYLCYLHLYHSPLIIYNLFYLLLFDLLYVSIYIQSITSHFFVIVSLHLATLLSSPLISLPLATFFFIFPLIFISLTHIHTLFLIF